MAVPTSLLLPPRILAAVRTCECAEAATRIKTEKRIPNAPLNRSFGRALGIVTFVYFGSWQGAWEQGGNRERADVQSGAVFNLPYGRQATKRWPVPRNNRARFVVSLNSRR